MAYAVVKNLSQNKDLSFYTYTPSFTKAEKLAKEIGGNALRSLDDFRALEIDFWLIGCKPQQLRDLCLDFNKITENPVIVSMLAATDVNMLEESFQSKSIFRIMPNTPIGVNAGVTLSFFDKALPEDLVEKFKSIFSDSGLIICKDERELDTLTVFSGCGPAYIYNFADTLFQKMKSLGFEEKMSKELLDNLFLGSAKLMKESNKSYSELLSEVTSKAGVTIEAVKEYKRHDLLSITSQAIDKAIYRTEELSKEIGN